MKITNISDWAEFGLAGLVIAALFVLLFKIFFSVISRFDKVVENHSDERKDWYSKMERRDEKAEIRDAKLSSALEALARSISNDKS